MTCITLAALTSCTKETVAPAPVLGKVIVKCERCTFFATWNKVTSEHSVDGVGYFDILNYQPGKYLFIDIKEPVDAKVTVFDPKGNIVSAVSLVHYAGADSAKYAFQLSIPLR